MAKKTTDRKKEKVFSITNTYKHEFGTLKNTILIPKKPRLFKICPVPLHFVRPYKQLGILEHFNFKIFSNFKRGSEKKLQSDVN